MAAKYNDTIFTSDDEDNVHIHGGTSTLSCSKENMKEGFGFKFVVNIDVQSGKGGENHPKTRLDADTFQNIEETTGPGQHSCLRRVFSEEAEIIEPSGAEMSSSNSCPDLTAIPVEETSLPRKSKMSTIRRRLTGSVKCRARSRSEKETSSTAKNIPGQRKRSKTTTEIECVQSSSEEEQAKQNCHAKELSVVKRRSSLLDKFRKWLVDDFGIKERINSSSDENLSIDVKEEEDSDCYLAHDLLEITNCPFYWGDINRHEAEEYLNGLPEGTFLLRDSAQKDFLFSVSFRRYGRTFHARLHQSNHQYTFDSEESTAHTTPSALQLLSRYSKAEFCMYFEPLLLETFPRPYPFSLQYLCRAAVCSKVKYQHVRTLPIPKGLQDYLKEYSYIQNPKKNHKGSEGRGKDTKICKRFSCR